MQLQRSLESRQTMPVLLILGFAMTLMTMHCAFAQSYTPSLPGNPLPYTSQNDPHGPLLMPAWVAGLAIAGVMSGVGVFTALRRR